MSSSEPHPEPQPQQEAGPQPTAPPEPSAAAPQPAHPQAAAPPPVGGPYESYQHPPHQPHPQQQYAQAQPQQPDQQQYAQPQPQPQAQPQYAPPQYAAPQPQYAPPAATGPHALAHPQQSAPQAYPPRGSAASAAGAAARGRLNVPGLLCLIVLVANVVLMLSTPYLYRAAAAGEGFMAVSTGISIANGVCSLLLVTLGIVGVLQRAAPRLRWAAIGGLVTGASGLVVQLGNTFGNWFAYSVLPY